MSMEQMIAEILAIKLYEHDCQSGEYPSKNSYPNWMKLDKDDKEIYRILARSGQHIK